MEKIKRITTFAIPGKMYKLSGVEEIVNEDGKTIAVIATLDGVNWMFKVDYSRFIGGECYWAEVTDKAPEINLGYDYDVNCEFEINQLTMSICFYTFDDQPILSIDNNYYIFEDPDNGKKYIEIEFECDNRY